jgi:hypothetical protein
LDTLRATTFLADCIKTRERPLCLSQFVLRAYRKLSAIRLAHLRALAKAQTVRSFKSSVYHAKEVELPQASGPPGTVEILSVDRARRSRPMWGPVVHPCQIARQDRISARVGRPGRRIPSTRNSLRSSLAVDGGRGCFTWWGPFAVRPAICMARWDVGPMLERLVDCMHHG